MDASLLSKLIAKTIHFVDIVPALINQIKLKPKRLSFKLPIEMENTHCFDVAELPLQRYDGKQLIIIAGIGGDVMSCMVYDIHHRIPQ